MLNNNQLMSQMGLNHVMDITDQISELSEIDPIILNLALSNFKPTNNERFEWEDDNGKQWNYTQNFRSEWTVPEDESDRIARESYKKAEFVRNLEYYFLFGKREENLDDFIWSTHFMNGIYYSIKENVEIVTESLDKEKWEAFLKEKAFRFGSHEKIMVCDDIYFDCLAKLHGDLSESKLGINNLTYTTSEGYILHLYKHFLFGNHEFTKGLGIIIDPFEIGARYIEKPAMGMLFNTGRFQYTFSASDPQIDTYFAGVGLELRNGHKHAMIKIGDLNA